GEPTDAENRTRRGIPFRGPTVTRRIFFKLFVFFFLVIAVSTVTLDIAVRRAWERSLFNNIEQNLSQKVQMFANRVRTSSPADYQAIAKEVQTASGARATIIDASGKVLADSEANPAEMENHATRPEFSAALSGKVGENSRRSHTVGIDFLYVATPIPNGAVRLAYPLSTIDQVNSQVRSTMLRSNLIAVSVALLLAGLAAMSISKRLRAIMDFSERIAAGDLGARIDAGNSSDEIATVAMALDRTARRLERSFREVEMSRKELE